MDVNVVLLAGGKGSRLWPISSQAKPKQFLLLPSIKLSSFQLALNRALTITARDRITIITNDSYHDLVIEQFEQIHLNYNDFNIILEKHSNNTGPAVYSACCLLLQKNQDDLTYFLPTDHYISKEDNFFLNIIKEVDHNRINILGERVKNLCSNFGYLIKGDNLSANYFKVAKFIEKPNQKQINELEASTNIYKNLGIYLAKPSVFYGEFKNFYDDLPEVRFDIAATMHQVDFMYKNLPIDKMITEKSSIINMYKINFLWQDIGSFESLYQYCEKQDLIDCFIDLENILKFNQLNQGYNLLNVGGKIRIVKS